MPPGSHPSAKNAREQPGEESGLNIFIRVKCPRSLRCRGHCPFQHRSAGEQSWGEGGRGASVPFDHPSEVERLCQQVMRVAAHDVFVIRKGYRGKTRDEQTP